MQEDGLGRRAGGHGRGLPGDPQARHPGPARRDYGFPNNPIGGNARDLELFVGVLGYQPLEALTAATKFGGQLMGMGDELGLLAPGYLADVLVVTGNPVDGLRRLQDPANLAYIIQGGQFCKSPDGR